MADDLIERVRSLPGAVWLLEALSPGEEAYLVGGSVRDLRRGVDPVDLDVVVVGDVAELAGRLGDRARAHERFGTVTLRGPGGVRYDLARARRERYPRPGVLPEVEAAGIEQDLARRDFTVNAIALGLSGPRAGELLAAGDALADLASGRLRVLHDESFAEDPTRLLRLARYAGRLGFAIEPRTEALARAAVSAGALDTVSGERLGAELVLLAGEDDPVAGFRALRTLGIDAAIEPGLGIDDPALARRAQALLGEGDGDGDPPGEGSGQVVLAAALLGVDGDRRRPLLQRLGVNAHLRDVVLEAARRAPELAVALADAGPPSAVIDAVGGAAPETVALAGALGGEAAAATASRWRTEWSGVRLDIDGGDLIAAGMSPGRELGAALRAALAAKLDGRAPTREGQLAAALGAAGLETEG